MRITVNHKGGGKTVHDSAVIAAARISGRLEVYNDFGTPPSSVYHAAAWESVTIIRDHVQMEEPRMQEIRPDQQGVDYDYRGGGRQPELTEHAQGSSGWNALQQTADDRKIVERWCREHNVSLISNEALREVELQFHARPRFVPDPDSHQ